jgi:hypothetical protein
MLRLASYYTPTHAAMFERFVLPRAADFDDCRVFKYGQTCPTGAFKQPGWNACMADKLRSLLALPTDDAWTLYVDADVALMPGIYQWASDFAATLEPTDVAFADDVIQWCAGVMLFRSSAQIREFWSLVYHLSAAWTIPDQDVIHTLRTQCEERKGVMPIQPRVLPSSVVCNWATVSAPDIPQPWTGEPFAVPESCLAWHANWTVGVDRKMAMLEAATHGRQHSDH